MRSGRCSRSLSRDMRYNASRVRQESVHHDDVEAKWTVHTDFDFLFYVTGT